MRGARRLKTERGRTLRRFSTKAELRLWNQLRWRQLGGHKFIRQHPIGPFIVDLVCREQRLIIEIDGGQHSLNERDKIRDQWLVERGYSVLRLRNNEILQNIESVLETIKFALADSPLNRRVNLSRPAGRSK
jgi:very-short-patch-repair endonuclease